MIPSHMGALFSRGARGLTILADRADLDLFAYASANGYTAGPVTIVIAAGVEVYASSTAAAAVVPGAFSPGDAVTLVVKGTITGAGGNGGDGSPGDAVTPAGTGQPGGTAIDATAASAFTFRLDRQPGSIIRAGGGGGGGGGAAADPGATGYPNHQAGGGGGGGGAGRAAATGGAGKPSASDIGAAAVDGANGTVTAGGAGGTMADISPSTLTPYIAGKGGDGGTYGAPGQGGVGGNQGGGDQAPGGAAGISIKALGNVVVITSSGTLQGPTT